MKRRRLFHKITTVTSRNRAYARLMRPQIAQEDHQQSTLKVLTAPDRRPKPSLATNFVSLKTGAVSRAVSGDPDTVWRRSGSGQCDIRWVGQASLQHALLLRKSSHQSQGVLGKIAGDRGSARWPTT